MEQQFLNISKDKFAFVDNHDLMHDKKLSTKPRGYMADAFNRFCKNKGAIVGAVIIIILVLLSIFAPLFTPYDVMDMDANYKSCFPKNEWFAEHTDFWDGCQEQTDNKSTFIVYYAMGLETGHNAVKNQKYEITKDGLYHYRLDSVHKVGTKYKSLSLEEYAALQEYQDEKQVQVIYPIVPVNARPDHVTNKSDANYYFKTSGKNSNMVIEYDENGNIIPVYDSYEEGNKTRDDGYTSTMRIEGEDGYVGENNETRYYYYSIPKSGGVEVRINYYEYYIYEHTMLKKDGITTPNFLFGTTSDGQDIFTCLFMGARFSFLFGLLVALVNMLVGAIYGSIEGYYGGKIDLFMERFSDILAAVPSMIVITLLQQYMRGSSSAVILFVTFFATGWIGMASTTRMQFYRYKNQEYVLAARTLGARDSRLIFKHIFPNALGTLVTSCALVIPSMIYSETNLTYLNIINLADINLTTVGTLIANGQANLQTAPFIALFPAVFLALLMLSFNLFGNGLRDAFNPSLRGSE